MAVKGITSNSWIGLIQHWRGVDCLVWQNLTLDWIVDWTNGLELIKGTANIGTFLNRDEHQCNEGCISPYTTVMLHVPPTFMFHVVVKYKSCPLSHLQATSLPAGTMFTAHTLYFVAPLLIFKVIFSNLSIVIIPCASTLAEVQLTLCVCVCRQRMYMSVRYCALCPHWIATSLPACKGDFSGCGR